MQFGILSRFGPGNMHYMGMYAAQEGVRLAVFQLVWPVAKHYLKHGFGG